MGSTRPIPTREDRVSKGQQVFRLLRHPVVEAGQDRHRRPSQDLKKIAPGLGKGVANPETHELSKRGVPAPPCHYLFGPKPGVLKQRSQAKSRKTVVVVWSLMLWPRHRSCEHHQRAAATHPCTFLDESARIRDVLKHLSAQ